MGILSDFFVAQEHDAVEYGRLVSTGEPLPADRFRRHEWKGFTPLELATLWAIIDRREWSADDHTLEWVGEETDGETWLARFPGLYVERLATLASPERSRVVTEWAATEEIAESPETMAPILDSLVELARDAIHTGRGLFLWGSL